MPIATTAKVRTFLAWSQPDLRDLWHLDIFKVYLELEATFEPSRGRLSFAARLRFVIVYSIALILALGFLVRWFLQARRFKPLHGSVKQTRYVGLHVEDSTRTRFLVRAFGRRLADYPILVLGRPTAVEVEGFTKLLDSVAGLTLSDLVLIQPRSWSVLTLLPRVALTGLARLYWWQQHLGQQLSVKKMTSVILRILLGQAQSCSWQQDGVSRAEIVLAHTGTGDTTALEYAVQAKNGFTVHLLHGVSIGYAFYGASNVLVCQCAHDARWMKALGGYQHCMAYVRSQPSTWHGKREDFLILSNFLHPMDSEYQKRGLAPEQELLTCIAAVRQQSPWSDQRIFWKPHPVFAKLTEAEKKEMLTYAASLGIEPILGNVAISPDLLRGKRVICTISTTILDVIALGVPPVVYEQNSPDAERFYGVIDSRLKAATADGVYQALLLLEEPERLNRIHADLWSVLGPAPCGTVDEIFSLMQLHPNS